MYDNNINNELANVPPSCVQVPGQGKAVRVGQTVNMQIAYSLKGPVPAANIISWSVNGIVRGNSTIGTIIPTSIVVLQTAEYTAPATKPTPNSVDVLVLMQIGTESIRLWGRIFIFDAPVYFGTVEFWGVKLIGTPEITSEIQWYGSSILYFNQDPVINGFYNIDTVNSKVRFFEYTIHDRYNGTSAYLVESAWQIFHIGGALAIIQNNKYAFWSKVLINGKMRSANNNIYVLSLGTDITSLIHDNFPYRDLGDEKNLKGESTFSDQ